MILASHLVLPLGPGHDGPPLPLTRLAIGCPAEVSFLDYAGRLDNLTRLELSQCSFEADRTQAVAVLKPPLFLLPRLLEFELTDGTLLGDLSAGKRPWLPPSLTSLALCNAGLRELPGVLRHLPLLRRCAAARALLCGCPLCCAAAAAGAAAAASLACYG